MPDTIELMAYLITGLSVVAWTMIKGWKASWETRLTAQDKRLNQQGLEIATITANMEHIRVTGDETRKDVKELLKNSNGRRTTAGTKSP